MANNYLEKRRKAIEKIFDILFWFQAVLLIIALVLKILFITGHVKEDVFSNTTLIFNGVVLIFLFISTKLAKKGHISAAILGVIIGAFEIFIVEGLLSTVLGVLLLINSALFIISYYEK